jgi:hypothetical protein
MTKYGIALVLLFAASCMAGAQKPKPAKFLPPLESHGMAINGYGCDRLYVADTMPMSRSTSLWALIVWAQYGKDHKKYWQKTYNTYEIPYKNQVHSNGESAGSGAAIGGFENKSYDFTLIDKACAEWGAQMKSALKMDLDAEKPKE